MAPEDEEPSVDLAALSERLESINRVARNTQTQQAVSTVDSVAAALPVSSSTDAHSAASELSESKAPAIDELSLDDEDNDENRNKR